MTVSRHYPRTHLDELASIAAEVEAWNDPRVNSGTVGSTGKPTSRPPGRTQCDHALKLLTAELERCVKRCRAIRDGATIFEPVHEVRTVAGVSVIVDEEHLTEHRRVVRIEAEGESRAKRHLLAKYGTRTDVRVESEG